MNLWHGLSPSSLLYFERLEPTPRLRLREQIQIDLLKQVDPDIAFFQEMNPITTRFQQICRALNAQGVSQPDLVGTKIFGWGFPVHLFSGLAILTRPVLPLDLLAAVRLSGGQGRSFVHKWASLQLQEERFAVFAETHKRGVGRILLVNTHLHHGLEATEAFLERLKKAMDECELPNSARSEIHERLFAGNERRDREMSILLRELETRHSHYDLIILGGDFNCEPDGDVGQKLRDLGFMDAWKHDHPNEAGFTYDRVQNLANHILQDRFPSTLMTEDLSFSAKTKEVLVKLVQEQERRARRIDQLWIRSPLNKVKEVKTELVGFPDEHGMAPSDHFGLVANLVIE
jgi:endonuclease/exonuclease/phosphatase family metal-dependent hydrolase